MTLDDLDNDLQTLSTVKGPHRHCRVSSQMFISLPLIGHGMIVSLPLIGHGMIVSLPLMGHGAIVSMPLIGHGHVRTLFCSLYVAVLAVVVLAVIYLGHFKNCYFPPGPPHHVTIIQHLCSMTR